MQRGIVFACKTHWDAYVFLFFLFVVVCVFVGTGSGLDCPPIDVGATFEVSAKRGNGEAVSPEGSYSQFSA